MHLSSICWFVAPDLKLAREKTLSPSAAKLRLLKRLRCTLKFEKLAWQSGANLVAGVDEVGRGSLFGPVVAAAVILDAGVPHSRPARLQAAAGRAAGNIS